MNFPTFKLKHLQISYSNQLLYGKKVKEMVNSVPKRKNKMKRQKKTLTCYSNFQMAFSEVSVKKKKEEEWLLASLERKNIKEGERNPHMLFQPPNGVLRGSCKEKGRRNG